MILLYEVTNIFSNFIFLRPVNLLLSRTKSSVINSTMSMLCVHLNIFSRVEALESSKMLSVKRILKVERLLKQTGEPRPGYLHDETDNFEGQATLSQSCDLSTRTQDLENEKHDKPKCISVTLEYEVDSITKDVRIVKK